MTAQARYAAVTHAQITPAAKAFLIVGDQAVQTLSCLAYVVALHDCRIAGVARLTDIPFNAYSQQKARMLGRLCINSHS